MRKLIKKFRVKYKQAVNEIKDLNHEHTKEKQDLFETLQDYEKENSLYKSILRTLIHEKELAKVLQKCEYDNDNRKWEVPLFVIKEKIANFPKMPTGLNN